jgi:ribonucleoside-diphosphate reductase alpha chain
MKEWQALYESKSGERGIFNRVSAQKQAARNGRRDADQEFGTNP